LKVAVYCRLSKEDEEREQSESIKNQETSLLNYARERNWKVMESYLDDGYSGTSFERPGFQRMIRDIQDGLIDCVITKDYSRLGREHIQTSYYTEIFFPQYGVRYLAINDGIDTQKEDDFLGIRAVFNDLYARDISKKIRYTLKNKQKEGAFIGAFAPYGYQKDAQNHNRLLVDPLTAPIIEEIFQFYLAGWGKSRIATLLNKRGVPSPAAVKPSFHKLCSWQQLWSPLAVKRILENEVYLGHTLQHKKEKVSYKLAKQIHLPKEEWIRVENTHEPILDKVIFEEVQAMIGARKKDGYFTGKKANLFSGLVKCGLCGSNYVYSSIKKNSRLLLCGNYKRYYSRGCQKREIEEAELKKIVLKDLEIFFKQEIDRETFSAELASALNGELKERKKIFQEDLATLQHSLEQMEKKFLTLYNDKLNGLLEEKEYLFFKNRLERDSSFLKERINLLGKKEINTKTDALEKMVENFLSLSGLDRETIFYLVDKIQVMVNSLQIFYRFKPPLP